MRVSTDPRLPNPPTNIPEWNRLLSLQVTQWAREAATQLNLLSEGAIQAATNAAVSAPTSGTYQHGDTIRNATPTELGSAGAKYVVIGWVCVSAGSPGAWKEMRCLTGG